MRTEQSCASLHLVGDAFKSPRLLAERTSLSPQCDRCSAKCVVAPLRRRPDPRVGSGRAIAVEYAQSVESLRERSKAGSPTAQMIGRYGTSDSHPPLLGTPQYRYRQTRTYKSRTTR